MPRNLGTRGFYTTMAMPSTVWVQTVPGNASTITTVLNTVYAAPFVPHRAGTLTGVSHGVTTAGASSNVIRMGIYNHDYSTGLPGTLFIDAGTVSSTTTGQKTLNALSQAIDNKIYWACVVSQVGTTCTLRGASINSVMVGQSGATPTDQINACYTMTGITGALPGTFTVAAVGPASPMLMIRVT
jgi:hypothetical protein